jgi:hypothetical protein
MKPFQANLLNAAMLVLMGLWGYFSSTAPSNTALIPVIFGGTFLVATPPFKQGNTIVANIILLLTFLLVIALFMPLKGSVTRGDTVGIIRVIIMLVTSILALTIFIRNLINKRNNSES